MSFIHIGINPEVFVKCPSCCKLVAEATTYKELIPENKNGALITCPHCNQKFGMRYSSEAKVSINLNWE